MPLRRHIATAFLTVMTALLLVTAPSAFALNVDFDFATNNSDDAQGDVTSDQCANLDESLAASLGCDTSDRIIDFTEYTGGLEAPDAAGYDSTLTQNRSAREFIQTVVNFALSFLGLVATIIVIYGGALYVLSRGDEEMASKGKKTIGYAAVGILIILGSFALVNTLLSAGGGGRGSQIVNGGGSTITEAGGSFDVASVVNEVESITADYVETYQTFLAVQSEIFAMKSLEMPLIVDVEVNDVTIGGGLQFLSEALTGQDNDFRDQYELINERDINDYIDNLREGIRRIQRLTDNISLTYESSQALFDYLRTGSVSQNPSLLENLVGLLSPVAQASNLNTLTSSPGCLTRNYSKETRQPGLGVTIFNTSARTIDDDICTFLDNMEEAANQDYIDQVERLKTRFADLQALFDTSGAEGQGSSLANVLSLFNDAQRSLNQAQSTVSVNQVQQVVQDMDALIKAVQNLQFVQVRMTASVTDGNAPLIVSFDVLGTEDPSGRTVQDEQIYWDLFGTGNFLQSGVIPVGIANQGASFIGPTGGDALSVRYNEAGTYRARVKVLSSDPNIAAGVATITVIVRPPKSSIVLTATSNDEASVLADATQFPAVDIDTYKVTAVEAKEGIDFSLAGSVDGDGDDLVAVSWDFGDGVINSGPWETFSEVNHAYGTEGRYQVTVTVTDKIGVQDKKIFNLFVASPAARISFSPKSGAVGSSFNFDGSGSSADVGTIVSYRWTATGNGNSFDLGSGLNTTSSFEDPGVYTVSLEVTDSTQVRDTASVNVLVESQSPVPKYSVSTPSSNQPGIRHFDASDSSDPDKADVLSYEWDFDGVLGQDYIVIDQTEDLSEITVQFLEIGTYNVALSVMDQHPEELRKTAQLSKAVLVDSVLDVDLQIVGERARQLDANGQVQVDFIALSEVATGFEINYGDGTSDFTESILSGESRFLHTYDQAGVFFVTLTALDDSGKENTIVRRLYVGTGNEPIAVIDVTADDEDIGFGELLTGNVNTKFTFDASNSVNIDGSSNSLLYTWNFGDGVVSNQKVVTHTYDELANFTVTLTVKDRNDPTLHDDTTVQIRIQGLPPEIRGVTITPAAFETPTTVNVRVDAVDEDGKINFIKGWYYDVNDSAKELGTVLSQTENFSLTINTNGEEGEEREYGFAVEVTDDSNNTVSSYEELPAGSIPTYTFVNGPNDTPVASFTVDQTSTFVGEAIQFTSTSYDPDGEIVSYEWDIGADGFFNDEAQENPNLEYVFTQIHPEGIPVRLRVTDNSGASNISESTTLFIDALSNPPQARFFADVNGTEVNFRDNSIFDTENGASLQGVYWDFDLATDSDGNGNPADDFDSFEPNAIYNYPSLGTYQVTYTVVDTTGQSDSVTQNIAVVEAAPPRADFTYTAEGKNVNFENRSSTDLANAVDLRSYVWDFDLKKDSDGDGDPRNDMDSAQKNPTHLYTAYGVYEVSLTIEDTHGKKSETTQMVNALDPDQPFLALFTAVPLPNAIKQVKLKGPIADVTFFFSTNGGSGDMTYSIDGNIFYDSNGDGIRENDADFTFTQAGSVKVTYNVAYGQIVAKLTATDNTTGLSDVQTLQVVFEGSALGANLFNATPSQMMFLILSAMLTATLGIVMAFPYKSIHRIK